MTQPKLYLIVDKSDLKSAIDTLEAGDVSALRHRARAARIVASQLRGLLECCQPCHRDVANVACDLAVILTSIKRDIDTVSPSLI